MSKAALVPGHNGRRLALEGLDQACVEGLGQGYLPQVQCVQPNYGLPFRPSVGTCPKANPANVCRPGDPLIVVVGVAVQFCLQSISSHWWPASALDEIHAGSILAWLAGCDCSILVTGEVLEPCFDVGNGPQFSCITAIRLQNCARYGKLNGEEITAWTDVAHRYPHLRLEIPYLVRLRVVLQTFIAQRGFISSVRQHAATLDPIATMI